MAPTAARTRCLTTGAAACKIFGNCRRKTDGGWRHHGPIPALARWPRPMVTSVSRSWQSTTATAPRALVTSARPGARRHARQLKTPLYRCFSMKQWTPLPTLRKHNRRILHRSPRSLLLSLTVDWCRYCRRYRVRSPRSAAKLVRKSVDRWHRCALMLHTAASGADVAMN